VRYSEYDERRQDKPVRLDRTEGTVIIEGKVYPAREIVEALAQSGYSEIRSSGDALILGRKKISPIFKSSKERAMASLCHGSLAYCCPLSKRCAERTRALEILGLSGEEYERLKGDAHHRFMDIARGGSSSAYECDDGPRSRTVNDPAYDQGFGSDDYRRDFDRLDSILESREASDRMERSPSWTSSGPSTTHTSRDSDFRNTPSGYPYAGARTEDSLMNEMRSATRNLGQTSACKINADPNLEGIGALFAQGELSPFNEETQRKTGRLSFCFSCGRTFEPGTKVCPYCGAPQ
jgi:hypothetical protein